jgi:hypothetical protein
MATPIQAQTPKQRFNEIIISLMETLDALNERINIGDGFYLEFANYFGELHKLQDTLKTETVYIELAREVRRRREGRIDGRTAKKPSLQEKLQNPNYTWCKKCNTPIRDLEAHQKTAKCSSIHQIKHTAVLARTKLCMNKQKYALFLNRFFDAEYNPPHTPMKKMKWTDITQQNLFQKLSQEDQEKTMAECLSPVL